MASRRFAVGRGSGAGTSGLVALMAMVAERSGRSWRTTLRMARPVRCWTSRERARAVKTMVRCASIASRSWGKRGRARKVGLGHPERRFDLPQVVVAGDDLTGGHHGGGDVGDVALQADQASRAGQGDLVQQGGPRRLLHEPWRAGRLLAGDDGLGPVLLKGEGLVVAGGALGRVGPHRPPRRCARGVPGRFGTCQHVVVAVATGPAG